MDFELLEKLRGRSAAIHVAWETLLRVEPVSSPLANPDTLTRLIPDTIAHVLTALCRTPKSAGDGKVPHAPICQCGCNPYLSYFIAGEQAFVEAAVLAQAELAPPKRSASDINHVIRVIRQLAENEIDDFCGVCTHRGTAHACRHPARAEATALSRK